MKALNGEREEGGVGKGRWGGDGSSGREGGQGNEKLKPQKASNTEKS